MTPICTVCWFSPATEGERCLMCSAETPVPEWEQLEMEVEG